MRAYRARISSTSCGLVGRPPRMSCRYGSTSSIVSGPPYAMTRTASEAPSSAMHEVYHGAHGRDIGLGQDPMAQVEDVPRPSRGALQDITDLTRAFTLRRQQRGGLEVALDRAIADSRPGGVERNAPVDADHVAAGGREILEKGRRAGAEMNEGSAGLARDRQGLSAVRRGVGAIVIGGQTTNPAVEQLQRVGAGTRLRP